MSLLTWIVTHFAEITAIGLAVVRVAESIVKATPGTADDEALAKVVAVLKEFFRFG